MAQVVLEDVSKTFPPDVKAVVGVSLCVSDGEFVVMVGPSGCGKSTTLRMVAGLEEVTAGVIRIGDRVVNDVAPKDRDIAMVFQNYALYPHMTVYKNMAFGLKLRHYPKQEIDSRVRAAADLLGLEGLMDRKPKALSGGQRQRVALARAIVRQPQAFLFDEPLSNLDAKLRVQTRAELKQLHHRLGTTTLYVTHDQEEAMTLSDRVVVMREGAVHQCDSPLNVYDFPCNLFVAGFIGTPPMNLIDGWIEFQGEAAYFVEGKRGDSGEKFALPREYWPVVQGHRDGQVVFGVRPENLALENRTGEQQNAWALNVTIVETLGERMDVFASSRVGNALVARMDAHDKLSPGESVKLYMEMNRVHLFEPGPTGANITCQERPHNVEE